MTEIPTQPTGTQPSLLADGEPDQRNYTKPHCASEESCRSIAVVTHNGKAYCVRHYRASQEEAAVRESQTSVVVAPDRRSRTIIRGGLHWVMPLDPGASTATTTPGPIPDDETIRRTARLALHDGSCPEGEDCRSRESHSQSSIYYLQWSSIADAMIRLLGGHP